MRFWREWVEEHWAGVGLAVSLAGALTVAVILALAFNVIATRLDGANRDTASAGPPTSNVPSRISAGPES